jgi:hypothetical protein
MHAEQALQVSRGSSVSETPAEGEVMMVATADALRQLPSFAEVEPDLFKRSESE